MLALCLSLLVQAEPVVVPFGDAADTTVVEVPFSVSEVRDARRMASLDPNGIGVTTIGVFEERAPLRTAKPVAQEVEAFCRKRLRSSVGALPVRLEILSLETWSKPVDGPDPFQALARVRVVSVDSSRPGVLLVPEARSERKGVTTAADQSTMLASSLHDALAMVRADMQPVPGAATPAAPEFDPWADPRKGGVRDSLPMRMKHTLSLVAGSGWNTPTMGIRYGQHMEPQAGWIHGYYGSLTFRAPWTDDDFRDVWSGEVAGGMAWWRRLDDGRSNWATTNSLGGLLGTERFRRFYGKKDSAGASDYWVYLGAEARTGLRWAERTESGPLFEGGVFSSIRIPSSLAYFDFGLYGSAGWRF